jgi:exopolysaccharide biosynthesis polyprenyl glycosylphosphotransferase
VEIGTREGSPRLGGLTRLRPRIMALVLALLEGSSIFAVAGGVLLIWKHPALAGRVDVPAVLAEAAEFSLFFLVAFYYADFYNPRVIRSFEALLGRVPRALAVVIPLVVLFSIVVGHARITGEVLESSVYLAVLIIFGPFLPLRVAYRLLRSRHLIERLLIVGTSPLARTVIEEIDRQPDPHYTVVGVAEDTENLGCVIEATRPDRIVVALAERRGRLPAYRLVESLARGIVVEEVAETYELLTGKLALEALPPSSVIFSRDFRMSRLKCLHARALSILVSGIGLILLAPVFGLIALLIKLDSRGPVFFIQERVGLSGRPFKLIKFRTMHPVSRSTSDWERDNRDRITRLGRWLRRFRGGHSLLDELPQLVNVLRGDMNLVGPRPHTFKDREMMILAARNLSEITGDAIPYYSLRCSVRPGVTGWAQIHYSYANSLEEEIEKIRYDLYYIKYRSFWLDLAILFGTLKMLFGCSETAYATRPIEAGAREAVLQGSRVPVQGDEYAIALASVKGP